MLFNSFPFLIFFPVVCVLYFLVPGRFRTYYLLAASYFYYICWNPKYAILLLASTAITYVLGIAIEGGSKSRKKRYLVIAVCLNLGILFFFKYFDFGVDSLNKVLSAAGLTILNPGFDIVLPIGISFYTFQVLGYLVDVYRGDEKAERSFINYALFVSFFLKMVAGPIERSKNLLKQIEKPHGFSFENMRSGLILMGYGYFQKVVLSDNAAIFVSEAFDFYPKYSGTELLVATLLFAVQIYGDFCGYSNMARGAARIMGFELIDNFNAPYLSASVPEFWRRWHISLSSWFRDYLYIPLGGNRKGRARKYFNIMVVFLASGLWHGASWHYVIWGGINGFYQLMGDLLKPVRNKMVELFHIDRTIFSHKLLKILVTFLLIDLSWVFFRANSVTDACTIIWNMITNQNLSVLMNDGIFQLGIAPLPFMALLVFIALGFAVDICKYNKIDLIEKLTSQGIWLRWAVYFAGIFIVLVFGAYGPVFDAGQFIYSQF